MNKQIYQKFKNFEYYQMIISYNMSHILLIHIILFFRCLDIKKNFKNKIQFKNHFQFNSKKRIIHE